MQRGTLKCSGVTSKQGRRTSHLFYCCTLVSVRVLVCVCVLVLWRYFFYPFASWHNCAPVLNKVSCKHTHTRTYKQHTHIPTYTHTDAHIQWHVAPKVSLHSAVVAVFCFFGHLQYARHFAYHFPPTPCGIESQLVTFRCPSPPFSLFLLFYYRWCSFL